MEKYSGKSIYKGIAIGRILFYGKKAAVIKRYKVEDPQAEIERYERAKKAAVSQLNKLYETAVLKVGEENAAIFEVHAMLLEDDDFNDSIRNMIMTQQINAEYAAAATGENFSNLFAQMEDEYFRARSADIKDISERVVSILSGKEQGRKFDEPVIVAADDPVSYTHLGYQPSAQAQVLRTKRTKLVGVIIPKINSDSISRMVAGISSVLSDAGYELLLANTDNNEKMCIRDSHQSGHQEPY